MSGIISLIMEIMGMNLATFGGVSISMGMVAGGWLAFMLTIAVFRFIFK